MSRSALEASDCFQFLPGLVTRLGVRQVEQLQINPRKPRRQAQFFNRNNGVDWRFLCDMHALPRSEKNSAKRTGRGHRH